MPKNEKEHAEDMLSFDELKDKVQPDTDETDPEVAALLVKRKITKAFITTCCVR